MKFERLTCKNDRYEIFIVPYTFDQYRIQICDNTILVDDLPNIIREMCTYQETTKIKVVKDLIESEDPLITADTYAKPYNCEGRGGRIRLDNQSKCVGPMNQLLS